jgi:hypothetical protein
MLGKAGASERVRSPEHPAGAKAPPVLAVIFLICLPVTWFFIVVWSLYVESAVYHVSL